MFQIQGDEDHAAESKHQPGELDQIQEGMPAQVAQHEFQNHLMKIVQDPFACSGGA